VDYNSCFYCQRNIVYLKGSKTILLEKNYTKNVFFLFVKMSKTQEIEFFFYKKLNFSNKINFSGSKNPPYYRPTIWVIWSTPKWRVVIVSARLHLFPEVCDLSALHHSLPVGTIGTQSSLSIDNHSS